VGLFFRKSVNLGPLRLNFSKSGIGTSVGVKGARVSFTPRGTYINMGAHGIYYRKRLDPPPPESSAYRQEDVRHESHTRVQRGEIWTADAGQLVDSSSKEMLSEINRNAARLAYAPFVWIFGLIATVGMIALLQSQLGERAEIFSLCVGIVGVASTVVAAIPTAARDSLQRTTPLFYELDELAEQRFDQLQHSCRSLGQSQRVWRVQSSEPNWDWKRNAGASSLVTRQVVTVGPMRPPYLATNVEIWGIDCGQIKLLFFPNWVFVLQGRIYGAVAYESLTIECAETRFVEDREVPRDSTIVGHTWQYVRRDGGPDGRFSNNRQLPVALYAFLRLSSPLGLNIHLHASNVSAASTFTRTTTAAKAVHFQDRIPPKRPGSGPGQSHPASPRAAALAVLGLSGSPSDVEIKAAYRRMVLMYHPDKVATLAPEFQELAHRRMKEINAAYALLSGAEDPLSESHPESQAQTFVVRCPHCNVKLAVPANNAGKVRKCPKCHQPIRAPVHSS
jgi:hypothetical protein